MQAIIDAFPSAGLSSTAIMVRRPVERDAAAVARACSDELIQRFTRVPSPYTDADAVAWIAQAEAELQAGTALHLVVVAKDSDELLGSVGLGGTDEDGRYELGYWTAPWARRRGVARSAAELLLRHVHESQPGAELYALVDADNESSGRLLHALGFKIERHTSGEMVYRLSPAPGP